MIKLGLELRVSWDISLVNSRLVRLMRVLEWRKMLSQVVQGGRIRLNLDNRISKGESNDQNHVKGFITKLCWFLLMEFSWRNLNLKRLKSHIRDLLSPRVLLIVHLEVLKPNRS